MKFSILGQKHGQHGSEWDRGKFADVRNREESEEIAEKLLPKHIQFESRSKKGGSGEVNTELASSQHGKAKNVHPKFIWKFNFIIRISNVNQLNGIIL